MSSNITTTGNSTNSNAKNATCNSFKILHYPLKQEYKFRHVMQNLENVTSLNLPILVSTEPFVEKHKL